MTGGMEHGCQAVLRARVRFVVKNEHVTALLYVSLLPHSNALVQAESPWTAGWKQSRRFSGRSAGGRDRS